jgi:hypothetical protein
MDPFHCATTFMKGARGIHGENLRKENETGCYETKWASPESVL